MTGPGKRSVRNKLIGATGVLWGAFIIASHILRGPEGGGDAYEAGLSFGFVFGFLMLGAGLYVFLDRR